ncbi:MAG: lysozyme [Kutzneria sp.]|nr:lysozyme [Kutzneria sp.]MBV9845971.1 lysozyme [Kutzneria sp.]
MAPSPLAGRKRLLVAALVITTGTPLLGVPASADATPSGMNPPVWVQDHQHNHTMGSQVARRQGHRYAAEADTSVFASTDRVSGMDVSSYQKTVDWQTAWNNGARFVSIKATEGTYYTNPYFTQQYDGSYGVGMIRGGYHFAAPNTTNGATQANYFVDHGGGWSPDGRTLPGVLDIEYNPYGARCYGLSPSQMVQWILDFSNTYRGRTGTWPVIYTTTGWWQQCTGNQGDFSSTNPLWVAKYAADAGALPFAWDFYTFWQYADAGTFPGDQDVFNGAYDRLQALAVG